MPQDIDEVLREARERAEMFRQEGEKSRERMASIYNPDRLLGITALSSYGSMASADPSEVFDAIQPEYIVDQNLASEFHKRLQALIVDFENELDPAKDVAIRLVSFGQIVQFHLEEVGYSDPSLIVFKGRGEGGAPIQLVQHVTQISMLLTASPRADVSVPRKPIGFLTEANDRE